MKKLTFLLMCVLTMLCTTVCAFAADGSSGGGGFGTIVIGVVIGIVIAVIIMMGHKGKLTSVRMEKAAANYIKKDSFRLTSSREIYLYQKVNRTPKPKDNN